MDIASLSFWVWVLKTFCICSFILAAVAAVVMIIIARSNKPAFFNDFKDLSGKTIVMTGGSEYIAESTKNSVIYYCPTNQNEKY